MSVNLRDFNENDRAQIERIHAHMGMDYRLPDISSPLMVARKCVTVDEEIVAACALRIEAETMLWVRPDIDPRAKIVAIRALNHEILSAAWKMGLTSLVAWIPETVESKFRRRLNELGWKRDRSGWHSWSREIRDDAQ